MNYSRERGFTLIEAVIIIAIIAMVAAIAIPSIIARTQLSQLEPGEIVIDKIPDPTLSAWYIVVRNYEKDYVKAKRVDIRTYYETKMEK